jgi:transcriptional regulator with XRE-family HTH domain
LSQSELAKSAGLSRPVISALEQGRGNPTLSVLEQLAAALDCRVTDLLKTGPKMGRFSSAGRKPSYLNWLANPPAGSKAAKAKDFGIDLTLLIENLGLTPIQRLRKLSAASATLDMLDKAKRGGTP